MDLVHIIDTLIGIVVMGGAYLGSVAKEIKRIDILVNRTREDYATRGETRDDMHRVMDALQGRR